MFARPIVILSRQAKNLISHILFFVLVEILRFAQNDKLGFVGEFRNGQDRSLRTKCIFRVGRG